MSGFDLRKILLPTACNPSWVSSYWKMCLRPRDPRLHQLQVWASQLSPSKGSTTISTQQKIRKKDDKPPDSGNGLLFCFVRLYLCIFMFTWYLWYFDRFSQHLAQFATVIYVIFIRLLDPHTSTFCYCAPAGVSETTSWRNWSSRKKEKQLQQATQHSWQIY